MTQGGGRGVMMRLDDRGNGGVIQGMLMKVETLWVTSSVNVGMEDDLVGIIRKDKEGHGKTNMFGNTNPITTVLMGI